MAHNHHRSTEVANTGWLADYRRESSSDEDSDHLGRKTQVASEKEDSGGISSMGSLNNPNHKDLADYIAEEKITQDKMSDRTRVIWQVAIFAMCFTGIQLVTWRDHVVIDVDKERPNSIMSMAVTIFQGIGYLVIGNLYDNVRVPKRLTFALLVILAILVAWVSIFTYSPSSA